MKKIIVLPLILGLLFASRMSNAQGCSEPTSEEGVTVFGFMQPQFDYRFHDVHEKTFRFNRMRIGVMGNIPYDFSYYFLMEASPWLSEEGNPFIIDAFVTYNRFEYARVSVGQFKKPLGLELGTACHGLHTIERSQFVNELTGPTNRDMGLMILGGKKESLINYQVAIMNGSGVGQANADAFMDFYGRMIISPIKNLKIGGSMLYGRDEATTEGAPNDERFRYGADLDFQIDKFRLQSEYLYGRDVGSYTTGGGCGGPPELHSGSIKRAGYFVMAMYKVTDQIQPVVKYEQYNTDMSKDDINQTTTVGLNYFFNDWTRMQINYQYRAEDPTEIDNDALLIQVQVKF